MPGTADIFPQELGVFSLYVRYPWVYASVIYFLDLFVWLFWWFSKLGEELKLELEDSIMAMKNRSGRMLASAESG